MTVMGAKRMLDDPSSVGSRQYTRVLALADGLPIKADGIARSSVYRALGAV
jgi:hypothetical protein